MSFKSEHLPYYAELGLTVTQPEKNIYLRANHLCVPYKGIPYCLVGHDNPLDAQLDVAGFREVIKGHHATVGALYKMLTRLYPCECWVLITGGMMREVVFGTPRGPLAAMYLPFKDREDESLPSGYLQSCSVVPFELRVAKRELDPFFDTKVRVPGVTLKLHRERFPKPRKR